MAAQGNDGQGHAQLVVVPVSLAEATEVLVMAVFLSCQVIAWSRLLVQGVVIACTAIAQVI